MRIIFGRFSEFKKKKSSEHNYLSEPTFRSLLRMTLLSFQDNGAKALIANVAIAVNTVIKIKKVLVLEITSFPPINAFIF